MKGGSIKEQILERCVPEKEIPFSAAEYAQRLVQIKRRMAEPGVQMLYLSAPESLYYVSGYKAEWYQAQSPPDFPPVGGIAVHVDHEDFILFDNEEEAVMCKYATIAKDIRIFAEEKQSDMLGWIVDELKKERWIPCKVALEMRSYRPNRVVSEMFQARLESAGCDVVDGTDMVSECRSVKSPKELEYVARAATIADVGIQAARDAMSPGVTELQVYGAIVKAMADAGGENPGITLPVVSGAKSACFHALASRKKIRDGEIVVVDVCGVYNRYHANLARTFSIGEPDPAVADIVRRSAAGFDRLADLIEPGMAVDALNREMKAYYEGAGLDDGLRWWVGGYELGIAFPPDWVGSFVYDPSFDSGGRHFVPGTIVNFESNFYLPNNGGCSAIINTLAFSKDSARILSQIPNDLIVVQ
ncbi:MAG: aminopeptidase P family protein [Methanobacteriota archaeon]|nr:MAG: aminopeptidase P family protein [Euryarchaeota archaeon]